MSSISTISSSKHTPLTVDGSSASHPPPLPPPSTCVTTTRITSEETALPAKRSQQRKVQPLQEFDPSLPVIQTTKTSSLGIKLSNVRALNNPSHLHRSTADPSAVALSTPSQPRSSLFWHLFNVFSHPNTRKENAATCQRAQTPLNTSGSNLQHSSIPAIHPNNQGPSQQKASTLN